MLNHAFFGVRPFWTGWGHSEALMMEKVREEEVCITRVEPTAVILPEKIERLAVAACKPNSRDARTHKLQRTARSSRSIFASPQRVPLGEWSSTKRGSIPCSSQILAPPSRRVNPCVESSASFICALGEPEKSRSSIVTKSSPARGSNELAGPVGHIAQHRDIFVPIREDS